MPGGAHGRFGVGTGGGALRRPARGLEDCMEFLARCGRCGALVEASSKKWGDGTITYYTPCAVVTEVSGNDVLVRDGCEYTVLCPDCVEQLKEWLAEAPGERQEAGQSSDGDSAERLAADVASAYIDGMRYGICQAIACKYFGHGGTNPCLSGDVCHAYGDGTGGSESCFRAMLDDVRKRCKALRIDLKDGEQ